MNNIVGKGKFMKLNLEFIILHIYLFLSEKYVR